MNPAVWSAIALVALALAIAVACAWSPRRKPDTRIRPPSRWPVALLGVLLLAACVPSAAIRHAERQRDLNRGHERDESLPAQARVIGQANGDAWEVQLEALDGQPLSPGATARVGPQ